MMPEHSKQTGDLPPLADRIQQAPPVKRCPKCGAIPEKPSARFCRHDGTAYVIAAEREQPREPPPVAQRRDPALPPKAPEPYVQTAADIRLQIEEPDEIPEFGRDADDIQNEPMAAAPPAQAYMPGDDYTTHERGAVPAFLKNRLILVPIAGGILAVIPVGLVSIALLATSFAMDEASRPGAIVWAVAFGLAIIWLLAAGGGSALYYFSKR